MQECDTHLSFRKLKVNEWDILQPVSNQLVVASVRGSDGKEDHCVTIYDKWLFDSNFDFALPLIRESLDLCCSAEDTKETFQSVGKARVCKYEDILDLKTKNHGRKKKKKKKKKNNQKTGLSTSKE